MADVACPQCGLPIVIVSSLTGKTVSCPQCQFHFIMPAEPEPQASVSVVSIYQTGATRKLKPANSLLDIFDFRFEKFVTPIIIRITWMMVVAAAALFAVWGAYAAIAPALTVGNSAESSFEPKSQYELRMPKGTEVPGSVVIMSAVLIRYGILLIGSALALLWIRVSLEMTIVAFNIATSLQSIDRKTKG